MSALISAGRACKTFSCQVQCRGGGPSLGEGGGGVWGRREGEGVGGVWKAELSADPITQLQQGFDAFNNASSVSCLVNLSASEH